MATDEVAVRLRLMDEMSKPLSGLRQNLRNVGQDTTLVAQRTERLQRASFGLGTSLRGLAGAYGALTLARSGFSQVIDSERAELGLRNVIGDAKEANRVLGELRQRDLVDPASFGQLAQASRSLVTYGIAAKDVTSVLKTLSDAAAFGGDPFGFDVIIRNIGQINQLGRFQGDELRSLSDVGVPAQKALANAMGITVVELERLTRAGELGADKLPLLFKALDEGTTGINGTTKAMKGSAAVMNQTLGTALSDINKKFGTELYGALKPVIPQLTDAAVAMGDGLGSAIRTTAPLLKGFAETIEWLGDHESLTKVALGVGAIGAGMSLIGRSKAHGALRALPGAGGGGFGGAGSSPKNPAYVITLNGGGGGGPLVPPGKGGRVPGWLKSPKALGGTALTAGLGLELLGIKYLHDTAPIKQGTARSDASLLAANAYDPFRSNPVLDAYRSGAAGTEGKARSFVAQGGNPVNVQIVHPTLTPADARELGRRIDDQVSLYIRERKERGAVTGPRPF